MTEKELKQFVHETLNEASPILMAAMMGAQNRQPVSYTDQSTPYKYNKLDLIYVTARKLNIEPELVKQVVDAGIFGAFKKKDPQLTPELVKLIKTKFEETRKERS